MSDEIVDTVPRSDGPDHIVIRAIGPHAEELFDGARTTNHFHLEAGDIAEIEPPGMPWYSLTPAPELVDFFAGFIERVMRERIIRRFGADGYGVDNPVGTIPKLAHRTATKFLNNLILRADDSVAEWIGDIIEDNQHHLDQMIDSGLCELRSETATI